MLNKRLYSYIIPNIFAMLGISCYVLADTFFISTAAGINGITALNLTLPVYGIMFAIGAMLGTGAATKFSLEKVRLGGKSETWFASSFLWAVLISLIFVVLGLFFPAHILRLMGADDTIAATGETYLRTVLLCAPLFLVNYVVTAFARNDNGPNVAMAATLCSSFFNILFDYMLMFPLGLGMFGAALATGLSPLVSILVCMVHYLSEKNTIRFVWHLPRVKDLLTAFQLGISAFVGEISGAVTNLVFNSLLLSLSGNVAVAAYGVVANVSILGIAIFNGVSQGLQPMASEAEGLNDGAAKRQILRQSLLIGVGLSAVLVAALWLLAEPVVLVFNSEGSARMAELAQEGLRLYSLGFLVATANIVLAGFYGAVGKVRDCFVISILRGVVAITAFAFLLSALFGIWGVWLAFPVAEAFTLLVGLAIRKK